MDKKIEFHDFIVTVPEENQDFVKELHDELIELGCKIEIKSAKSGYMVSYIYIRRQWLIMCSGKKERWSGFMVFM